MPAPHPLLSTWDWELEQFLCSSMFRLAVLNEGVLGDTGSYLWHEKIWIWTVCWRISLLELSVAVSFVFRIWRSVGINEMCTVLVSLLEGLMISLWGDGMDKVQSWWHSTKGEVLCYWQDWFVCLCRERMFKCWRIIKLQVRVRLKCQLESVSHDILLNCSGKNKEYVCWNV